MSPQEGPTEGGARSHLRSIRIDEHERGAYSSDRTRRGEVISDESRERPANVRRARGRRLAPSNRISYAPSSLVLLAGVEGAGQEAFAERLFDKGAVATLSLAKVRAMLARNAAAPAGDSDAQVMALASRVGIARLRSGQSVAVVGSGLEAAEREGLVRIAQTAGRPAHLIFLEVTADQLRESGVDDETIERDLPAAGELRRMIEQERLGDEGFATVLTLTPRAAEGIKQIGFDLDLRSPID